MQSRPGALGREPPLLREVLGKHARGAPCHEHPGACGLCPHRVGMLICDTRQPRAGPPVSALLSAFRFSNRGGRLPVVWTTGASNQPRKAFKVAGTRVDGTATEGMATSAQA